MSNLPPPTSGGAPYQPEQPTVAFNPLPPIADPAPGQKKSSKGRLIGIIAAAVIVVAGLVVAGLVVFGGDDDEGTVNAVKASGAVEDTTTAAQLDKTTRVALLETCPFDGLDDLAVDAPKDFDAATAAKGDDRAALSQTGQREDPILLQCLTSNEDATLLYGVTAAALPPTELKDYISRTLNDATAEFESTSSFRGGTLLPFCTTPKEGTDDKPLCATAWYNKDLMAAIFVTGDGATTDVTTAWIKDDLDDVVTTLEGSDPASVKVTDTVGFDIDATNAVTNLGKLIAAAKVDDAGAQADQTSCAIVDFDAVVAGAPSGIDQSTLSGDVFSTIIRPQDDGDPAFVVCADGAEDDSSRVAAFVGEQVPDDFEAYIKRANQIDDVTFEDAVDLRGGTLRPYCGTDATGVAFCETDWLTDGLQVGVLLAFDGVTADDATKLLEANLDQIIAATAAADATAVTPAS